MIAGLANSDADRPATPRHAVLVRVTHWLSALSFFALLLTGIEILISHPRFYWGETGNVMIAPLFALPIPASRATVPTGFGYVMPDQNGWSRYLHFEAAWLVVLTGLIYGIHGFLSGHFRKHLVPGPGDLSRRAIARVLADHLSFCRPDDREYNVLQRITYLLVIFGLFPLVIWTGLAMSPGLDSAFPFLVTVWGWQQSARTIHFFVTVFLVLFLLAHVAMVALTGFRSRMEAMTTGASREQI